MAHPIVTPEYFVSTARTFGVSFSISNGILTTSKDFEPGNQEQYQQAEADCSYILRMAPVSRSGSVWGTTSDGVGGWAGKKNGRMVLNRSGINKNWLRQLAKLM